MTLRVLTAVLLTGLASDRPGVAPAVGCRDTHEWIDRGRLAAASVAGLVEVQYASGGTAPLPEALVIVARIRPGIEAHVARTDALGHFALPDVPAGEWRVNVCMPGFQTLEADLSVNDTAPKAPLRFTTGLDW